MKIAFTGTTRGMTGWQMQRLHEALCERAKGHWQFHHGGAPGADRQAHYLARELGCEDLHVWLPVGKTWAEEAGTTVHHTRLLPLRRNHLVIGGADVVIAAPYQRDEIRRSGTWATVRYARKANITVVLLAPWPDTEEVP